MALHCHLLLRAWQRMKRALALGLFHNPGSEEAIKVSQGHLTAGLGLSTLMKQSQVSKAFGDTVLVSREFHCLR